MSPSTKSKPASPSSPATGDESKDPFRKEDPDRAPTETVEIDLEVSRQRWIAWAIGGTVGGVLLILKLGTVGVWAGYLVVALGLLRAYQLVMSFVHPAGKIVIGPKQVSLPRTIHRGNPLVVEASKVTAIYFLRRSVPWNRSAPVLVIELGEQALAYPRDWFVSEADQRRVVRAILSHLPDVRRGPDAPDGAAKAADPNEPSEPTDGTKPTDAKTATAKS
jgi:hypothetical protein